MAYPLIIGSQEENSLVHSLAKQSLKNAEVYGGVPDIWIGVYITPSGGRGKLVYLR